MEQTSGVDPGRAHRSVFDSTERELGLRKTSHARVESCPVAQPGEPLLYRYAALERVGSARGNYQLIASQMKILERLGMLDRPVVRDLRISKLGRDCGILYPGRGEFQRLYPAP